MSIFQELRKCILITNWPHFWPVISETIVDEVKKVIALITQNLAEVLAKHADAQERQAEKRFQDAEEAVGKATSRDEQIAAKAEAAAWNKVAEDLRKEHKNLRSNLDEVLSQGGKFAEAQIESEAIKGAVYDKVMDGV